MIKVALDVRSRATAKAEDQKPANSTFRDVERIRLERDEAEESLFQKNVDGDFIFEAFEWSGISFFEDGRYRFAPRVNVLLGKNGYGKTLLFRSLVAIAQRNEQYSGLVFSKGAPSSQQASEAQSWLRLEVTRNGDTEQIFRDSTYFTDLVGKIPVLAIPDSRFVNRARRTVAGAALASEPLVRSGAKHFLTQEPYEGVVQNLLTQLCLDYLEARRGRGFERPIFRLVEEVVEELTEDRDFRFADIKRAGTSQFEILVYTAGNLDNPIPLQSASQGTLSIVAIFGLIYSFLRTLRPKLRTDRVLTAAAIVLIDELDAHLHPSWQQRILGMLTSKFPNVQLVVSAHSPIIAAGCDQGEVSVLRKRRETGAHYVDTLPQDFLGANSRDLYKLLFEIDDDADRTYLEYTTKGLAGQNDELNLAIEQLEGRSRRTQADEQRLESLQRERRLIDRAEGARGQRLRAGRTEERVALLNAEIDQLKYQLQERDRTIERLTTPLQQKKENGDDAEPRVS